MLVSEGSEGGGLGQTQVKASQGVPRGGFPWISSSLGGGDSGPSRGEGACHGEPLLLGDIGELECFASHCFSVDFSSKQVSGHRGTGGGSGLGPTNLNHGVTESCCGLGDGERLASLACPAGPLSPAHWRGPRGTGESVGVARPGARDLMVHTQGHGFRWRAGSSALHCAQRVTARGLACPAHRGRRVPLGLGAPEVSVEGAAVHFSSKDRLALNPQGARAAGQALSVRAMRLRTPQIRGQGSGVQAETRCTCVGP